MRLALCLMVSAVAFGGRFDLAHPAKLVRADDPHGCVCDPPNPENANPGALSWMTREGRFGGPLMGGNSTEPHFGGWFVAAESTVTDMAPPRIMPRQHIPARFWFMGHRWYLAVTEHNAALEGEVGCEKQAHPVNCLLGVTDCDQRAVWILRGMTRAETRQVIRHELVHVFTACSILDASDDIDVFADKVADGYEALVGDERNAGLIRFLDRGKR